MDGHRDRPPAMDRQRLHADGRRGHPRPRPVVGLRAHAHRLRQPGRRRGRGPAGDGKAVARRGRGRPGAGGSVQPAAASSGAEAGAMSKADAVAAILWIGVTLYAVFGGADFGAGIWDLLAGRGERGERARKLIDHSIAPVWEANHVWLIFVLVVLWTAFPPAFSAVMTTLYIPLALAALGIVLRGSGFAFRHALPGPV